MNIKITENDNVIIKKTRISVLGISMLGEVFIPFLGLMPFILRKDLFATTFQIAFFTTLKPAVSVFSFYWSSKIITKDSHGIKRNLILAGILSRIPFLFFPFFNSIWYLIFSSAIYMLFSRAANPLWMEVLKLNLTKGSREKLFSYASILSYAENVLIALCLGTTLDRYMMGWKVFFVISTLLGLGSVLLQWRLPVVEREIVKQKTILKPWKEGIKLLRARPDFAKYQIGTMISGFGIMLVIPALAIYYADILALSYFELTAGRYIFMGLGYVFFSYLWVRALQKYNINFLTGWVCLGFALLPSLMLLAIFNKIWFYISFLSYGITQAGSHLIWNLSGPTFSGKEDSIKFSAINVLTIGIRGLIAPFLGGILCEIIGCVKVCFMGAVICFFGGIFMFTKKNREKKFIEE